MEGVLSAKPGLEELEGGVGRCLRERRSVAGRGTAMTLGTGQSVSVGAGVKVKKEADRVDGMEVS